MKLIRTEDAVGSVLCHDITQIIKDKKKGVLCVQSGAGIVADSVPEREYQECLNKAKAVVNAIHLAEGGLDK